MEKIYKIMGKTSISIFVFLFIFIFVVNLTSASLGTYQQNTCVNIKVLANCSVNLTQIENNVNTWIINDFMDLQGGQTYNYTFCTTSTLGEYKYTWDGSCLDCSQGDCGNNFEITYTGYKLTTEQVYIYMAGLLFLLILALSFIYMISKINPENNKDQSGMIVSINMTKHLRAILGVGIWILGLASLFIFANLGIAFLPNSMIGTLFFKFYQIMFWITIIGIPIYIIFIIIKAFKDKEMQKLIERGVDIGSL